MVTTLDDRTQTRPDAQVSQPLAHQAQEPRPAAHERAPGDRIAVLTGGGPLPWIIVNSLVERLGPITILEEDKEPLAVMVRRRAKMLGPLEAVGQVAFGVWLKFLHKLSARRKQQIIDANALDPQRPANCTIIKIANVNSDLCRQTLSRLDPDVVLVIGTRMINDKTLSSTGAIIMNYHAGLNPRYRGMNGGYWALANGEPQNLGVTMHLVDKGVDTGTIISFETLRATKADNFTTYPLLQAAKGRALVLRALENALDGDLKSTKVALDSKQWFHPTLWGYLWTGISRGVW